MNDASETHWRASALSANAQSESLPNFATSPAPSACIDGQVAIATLDTAMRMHSEGKIYLGFAVLGVALTAYCVERIFGLVQQPFASIDLAIIGAVATALFALTAFYSTVAFVFAARFVVRIKRAGGSLVLCRADDSAIQVNGDVRVIRRFGKQFSSDESCPAFVLFLANGRLWVSQQEEFERDA